MTYDERRERQRKYERASEQYRDAKRALNHCEEIKEDYHRKKLNLEKRLAGINEIIGDLRNDTEPKVASANRETQTAKVDYSTAVHSDTSSAADIGQAFHMNPNLDEELSGIISEKKLLEAEIERIRADIADLANKLNEYSSQMMRYKRIMNQYS